MPPCWEQINLVLPLLLVPHLMLQKAKQELANFAVGFSLCEVCKCFPHVQGESRDYYRSSNSLLPCVLTHKKGIPISLAVVHAAVGRRAGLPIDCIGMPMHLINRMAMPETDEERFIDVFRGGELLTRCTRLPYPSGILLHINIFFATV